MSSQLVPPLPPPYSFRPARTSDLAQIKFSFEIEAGFTTDVTDPATIKNFIQHLFYLIEQQGVRVIDNEVTIIKVDPYCGSKREKLIEDANNGEEKGRI